MNNKKTFSKKLFFFSLILILAAALFGKTKKSKTPQNVVALSKSLTEMWLLAGGQIAGSTDDGLELEGAKKAASVGTLSTTSLEAIVSLNPELVIMTYDMPAHKKLGANLKSMGINVEVVDINNFADYDIYMKRFTDLTGRADLYKKNVTDVADGIKKVLNGKTGGKGNGKTYLFLRVSSAKNKVMKGYFGNEIIENFGFKSIVEDSSSLDDISIEAIIAADPDYIFVVAQGDQKRADEAFYKAYQSNPAWSGLTAAKAGRIFMLPKELFNTKPNAEWAQAYQYLGDLID